MNRSMIAIIALFALIAAPVSASAAPTQTLAPVVVDWARGVYSTSVTLPVPNAIGRNSAKLIAGAKSKATNKAVASIVASLETTAVDSFHLGKDMLANPAARKAVVSYISSKCLRQSVTNVAGVPTVKVTAEVPIFKVSYMLASYAGASRSVTKSASASEAPSRVEVIISERPPMMCEKSAPDVPIGPFTSLIVDATGLKVERAMSPKIRRGDGSEVWGTVNIDPEKVLDTGVVAYAKTMEDAEKNTRAGDNPLVITAVGRSGGRFYCDPVVTDDDAKLILAENDKTHFCDDLKVIFVVDGKL